MKKSKAERFGWEIVDDMGTPTLISKHKLEVDHRYQRKLKYTRKQTQMQSQWSWMACLSLGVARRPDGRYFVFEGQHRLDVAMRHDEITHLPCLVFDMSDIQYEAMAFVRANENRGSIRSADCFKALLEADDGEATAINAAVRDAGLHVAVDGEDGVECIATIRRAWKKDEQATKDALKACAQLCMGHQFHNEIFKGLHYLIVFCRNSKADFGPLHNKNFARLVKAGFDSCVDQIAKSKIQLKAGGEKTCAHALHTIINAGRTATALPLLPGGKK